MGGRPWRREECQYIHRRMCKVSGSDPAGVQISSGGKAGRQIRWPTPRGLCYHTRGSDDLAKSTSPGTCVLCGYRSSKADAILSRLDHFLRDIWLECCGHLSAFRIDQTIYTIPVDDPFDDFQDDRSR
jgi:hypothetical protein